MSGGSADDVINDQVNGSFLWSYGATDRLELDVALPLTFGQGGTGLAPITGGFGLHDTAVRDMRFGFAYALVPHSRVDRDVPGGLLLAKRDVLGLAARFEMSAPTGDHDQFAGERSGVYVPSLAADFRAGGWRIGAELGARLRPITELLGARVGTQIVAMLGVAYDILPRELLTASAEAWALPTLVSQGPGQGSPLVPAEWQVAARTAPAARRRLRDPARRRKRHPVRRGDRDHPPALPLHARHPVGAARARYRRRRRARRGRPVPHGSGPRHGGRLPRGRRTRLAMSVESTRARVAAISCSRTSAGDVLPDALAARLARRAGRLRLAAGERRPARRRAARVRRGARPAGRPRGASSDPFRCSPSRAASGSSTASPRSRSARFWRARVTAAWKRWPARSCAPEPWGSRFW